MQPQSDIESNNKKTAATTSQQSLPTTAAPATATATNQQQNRKHHHHHHHHRSPKIIKGKKPLVHFKFYLDIRDHQLTKTIEEKITSLGGCLEFFLTSSITHFVTDKQVCSQKAINNNNNSSNINNNNNTSNLSQPLTPQTPVTPGTPLTPHSYEQSPGESTKNGGSGNAAFGSATTKAKKQSRADAMLNRVRRPSTTTNTPHTAAIFEKSNYSKNNNNYNQNNTKSNSSLVIAKPNYIIWSPEYAIRFFKRLSHDLKDYLEGSAKKPNGNKPTGTVEPISLKGGFIKIEAIRRNQRPYYQLFRKPTEWPKIELNREDGAFRLSPKRKPEPIEAELVVDLEAKKMTRKSRSRSSHNRATTKETGVQALKKSAADVGIKKSSNGRLKANSGNAGVGAVAVATAACKQLKETSEKQCGVCEICKIEYDTLTIHLKTKDHEYFAKNTQNFIALDTLIHTSANVNKFLDANKALDVKSELEEEMEVVEDVCNLDADAADPLEDHQPIQRAQNKSRSVGYTAHKTPSPTLREKSKRSTKGKHSSEKFKNYCAAKSSRSTSSSPQKKTSSICSSSKLELQSFKNEPPPTVTPAPLPASPRKKPAPVSLISPPIRAMLPPSSLYKVVETTLAQDVCSTPPRKPRDAGETAAAVASPSLIVKFKKVRQTELSRLNGEAENFMFPRTRTSSELPTDQDRQTSSENALGASASSRSISLESSSEPQISVVKNENIENNENLSKAKAANNSAAKRTIVVAKRRKGRPSTKQSFPSAPIQPEELTLKSLLQTTSPRKNTESIEDTSNAALIVATSLTLPEATRKSSRTATAIVTAATTSSRLLRAAVEAAKNNQRLGNDNSSRRRSSATPSKIIELMTTANSTTEKTILTPTATSIETANAKKQIKRRSKMTGTVVKLEDRMGEYSDEDTNEKDEYKKMKKFYADDDDDLDDMESEDEDDDDDDEDYVSNFRGYKLQMQLPTLAASRQKRLGYLNNREQRATNRVTKQCIIKQEAPSVASSDMDNYIDDDDYKEQDKSELFVDKKEAELTADNIEKGEHKKSLTKSKAQRIPKTPKASKPKSKMSSAKKKSATNKTSPVTSPKKHIQTAPQISFDISKSERIQEFEYAFERVPVADLWYRVFQRQDECEEKYFEYYGSTNYRKLPYELGPIPFNRTVDGITCKLCGLDAQAEAEKKPSSSDTESKKSKSKVKNELSETVINCTKAANDATATSTTTAPSSPTLLGNACSSSNYTHKKLHLMQRYRREQQELLLKQQEFVAESASSGPLAAVKTSSLTSKASTPDREAHERRAGSINSNASSCASSTDTACSKGFPRNKHLNKAAFLNLELPPRKSPREHASTLALVSCLIKQRQSSQSKPNSEIDEPSGANTPTLPTNCVEEDLLAARAKQQTPPPTTSAAAATVAGFAPAVRSTRSAAGTPVEELRFTTEISENVKRLRRGQNKYNYSPTSNPTTKTRMRKVPSSPARQDVASAKLKRRIRQPSKYHSYTSSFMAKSKKFKPSIRKTGTKKGVLEFEVDMAALKALDAARQYTNPGFLEWQIDKYLEYAGRTADFDADETEFLELTKTEATTSAKSDIKSTNIATAAKKSTTTTSTTSTENINTPPATDYFSSDFDLYDLFMRSPDTEIGADAEKDASSSQQRGNKKAFSLYNSVALQNYFKKRKSLKSNRTGWPKVHKKKIPARQQQQLTDEIRFLPIVSEKPHTIGAPEVKTEEKVVESVEDKSKEQTPRQNVVITPPDSDTVADDDEDADGDEGEDEEDDEEDDEDDDDDDENGCKIADNDTELDVAESIPEEDEDYADTMAGDSADDREADVEEEDDDDDDDDADEQEEVLVRNHSDIVAGAENAKKEQVDVEDEEPADDEDTLVNYEPPAKRMRRLTAVSPIEKMSTTTTINNVQNATTVTSTPSSQLLRNLRRSTPHLNGSLGSCVSPIEKAGDNSDIFTVSSDGLDTDLDLSNSHSALIKTSGVAVAGDEHETTTHCFNHTPKRKFDLAKYAASNNAAASSTCAAEAATANIKSLAISQFLKKEVKVTCRRLRAPFRRFRYRR